MEENKKDKILDAFTKKYLKEIELESPSKNFTATLMKQLEAKQKIVFNQQPLISKNGWFGIFSIILIVLFFSSKSDKKSIIKLPEVDFSFLSNVKIFHVFDFLSVSNTTMIAFLLFGGMFIFQLLYLKNYFDKRFE
jgi:hypothetical protein